MAETNFPIQLITDEETVDCFCTIPEDGTMPFLTYEAGAPASPHLNSLISPKDMLAILNAIKASLQAQRSGGPLQ